MVGANLVGWVFPPWLVSILNVLILLVGLFLILLVLIQRGKGGGLAGAFGGAGGSSAFGTRAGDAFTRITLIVAGIWLFLIMIVIKGVQPDTRNRQTAELTVPGQQGAPAQGPAGDQGQ